MVAPCGINCENCDMLRAARDRDFAEFLAADWRNSGHPKAEASWFTCPGCHGDDSLLWCENCAIRDCCIKDRKLQNCSMCENFPCDKLESFANDGFPNHKHAFEKLREMRDPDKIMPLPNKSHLKNSFLSTEA